MFSIKYLLIRIPSITKLKPYYFLLINKEIFKFNFEILIIKFLTEIYYIKNKKLQY